MKYYKNNENNLFVDPIVSNHTGLIEIDQEEFDLLRQPSTETIILRNEDKAKYTRQALVDGSVTVFGVEWQVGSSDRENIQEAIDYATLQGVSDVTTQDWILLDNTTRPTTRLELMELMKVYVERKQLIFGAYTTWRSGDKLTEFAYSEVV